MNNSLMQGNSVDIYQRKDGKWSWRIIANRGNLSDAVIATDGGQGYECRSDALNGMFSVFFGSYDESFLAAHAAWVNETGDKPEPYVRQAAKETRTGCGDGQVMFDGFAEGLQYDIDAADYHG